MTYNHLSHLHGTRLRPGNGSLHSADWIRHLRHICPQCCSSICISDGPVAAICGSCGFEATRVDGVIGFVTRTVINDWQEIYDARAEGQKGDTAKADGYNFLVQHRNTIEGFRKLCAERAIGAAILDVGCGNGAFWQALFGDRPVVGIDFSLSMCVLAREKGMRVYQADAVALPFADKQFDLIYSAETLQCVSDLQRFLFELARVCRPGGRIIVGTLNQSSWVRSASRLFYWPLTRKSIIPIRRRIEEITDLGLTMKLTLNRICWTHFPLRWSYFSNTNGYALKPFASNMIVEFAKSWE